MNVPATTHSKKQTGGYKCHQQNVNIWEEDIKESRKKGKEKEGKKHHGVQRAQRP